jgi:hypothetical protein
LISARICFQAFVNCSRLMAGFSTGFSASCLAALTGFSAGLIDHFSGRLFRSTAAGL